MRCEAWRWGWDKPHRYTVEFSKKEVEELLAMPSSKEFEYFGQAVWESLVAQYKKHKKQHK